MTRMVAHPVLSTAVRQGLTADQDGGPPSVRYSCEAGTYMTRMVAHPVFGTAVRQGLT